MKPKSIVSDGGDGSRYYDVHKLLHMEHHLAIPAYKMNGAPLPVLHEK